MSIVVDLITPPGSPQPHGSQGGSSALDAILLEDSPAPAAAAAKAPLGKRPLNADNVDPQASDKALGKRRAPGGASAVADHLLGNAADEEEDDDDAADLDDDDDDDDDMLCEEVAPPPPVAVPAAAAADGDADDDLQFVGRTGDLALADFPHSRENCLQSPWTPGTETKACPNCYCCARSHRRLLEARHCAPATVLLLAHAAAASCIACVCADVCDVPSSACPEWSEHAKATHKVHKWVTLRAQWKACGGKPPAPAAGASSSSSLQPSSSSGLSALRALARAKDGPRWSCARILKEVCQVYPIETPEPKHLDKSVTLHPCVEPTCMIEQLARWWW